LLQIFGTFFLVNVFQKIKEFGTEFFFENIFLKMAKNHSKNIIDV